MAQEKELLEASLRGDTAAFEQIIVRYQSLICAITLGATGRLDISEELAQETFLRAWKSLTQLKELNKFRAWLCTIARNAIQNYLRDKKRQPILTSDSAALAEMAEFRSPTVHEKLVRQEEETMMQTALMRIPQDYCEAIVLFYRQRQSIREVAEQLNLTEDIVRTRLHRGRKMLRKEVAAMVERTLERTAPSKDFTKAVMVAIGGIAVGAAASAQAAEINGTISSSGAAGGASTLLTGIGVKAAAIAAAIVFGAGILFYTYWNPSGRLTASTKTTPIPSSATQMNNTPVAKKQAVVNTPVPKPAGESPAQAQVVAAAKLQSLPALQDKVAHSNKPYEFKPRGVLSGLITDAETGEPATDVEVSINERNYTTKTDPNGFYYFDTIDEDGNSRLGIISIEYVGINDYKKMPTVNLKKDKQMVQHFQLKKACKVELRVNDPNGQPIPEASVYTSAISEEWGLEINDWRGRGNRTDKNGRIILGGFAANDYYLITVTHHGSEWEWDYAPTGLKIFLDKPGQTEYAEVVLEKGQPVKGCATYKDGQPADDIKISAYPDWWHSTDCPQFVAVEPNSFFTLEQIAPGNYQIQANIPAGEGSSLGHNLFSCQLPLKNNELLRVKVPFVSPKSLSFIRGKVKLAGDTKTSRNLNVYVNAYSGNCSRDYYLRIEDENRWGEFVLDRLQPGNYTLEFSGDGIEEKTLKDIPASSDNLEVELVYVGKPKLSGTVVDAQTGRPIKKFQIHVKQLERSHGCFLQDDQLTTFANDEGTFEVEAVGPGVYQVQALAAGYAPAWSEKINTDQNVAARIVLTAGGASIQGIVFDESGQPVKGAKVVPLSLASGTMWETEDTFMSDKGAVVTNDEGEFVLVGLPAGRESLKITHPEFIFTIVKDIQTTLGQCTANIKVTLRAGCIVEGFVYDVDGNPQEGVAIYAQDVEHTPYYNEQAGRLGTATSEPNGFYRITSLPKQICYLVRQNEWSMGVVRRTVLPKSGEISKVDFGGIVCLRGQVIVDDKPHAKQRIDVFEASVGNRYFTDFRARTETDSEGRFVVRGVIPARLIVYCLEQREGAPNLIKIAEADCGSADVDLGVIPKQVAAINLTIHCRTDNSWDSAGAGLAKHEAIPDFTNVSYMRAQLPASPDQPYVLSPVMPGDYRICIFRNDGLMFRQNIHVPENQKQVDLTVNLPAATAKIYGTISWKYGAASFWSEDRKIRMDIIPKTTDGRYEVNHLPAGKYRIGLNPIWGEEYSIPLYLGDGQQLMMNLDENLFGKLFLGIFYVQTISTDGRIIEGTKIRLEADGRVVRPYGQNGSEAVFATQAGQYTLHISCEGYRDFQQMVTLDAMKPNEIVEPRKDKIMIYLEPK